MAEEKKTPKPRKPRAPKTQPKVEETSELKVVEEVTEVEEETKLPEIVEPAPEETPSEESIPEEEPTAEEDPVEENTLDSEPEEDEPLVEETELPEDTPTYEEFSSSLETSSVEIKKLNPNLPDSKSKWVAQIPYGNHSIHILFKGSYVKTLQAARNYNKARGFSGNVKEIRSN